MKKKLLFLSFFCTVLIGVSGQLCARDYDVRLTGMDGTVGIRLHGDTAFSTPKTGMILEQGDLLKTKKDSFAEVSIDGRGIILIEENSTFTVGKLDTGENWFKLGAGTLLLTIGRLLKPKEVLNIRTRTAVVGIRGTELAVETEGDGMTHIGVFKGKVEVFSVMDEEYDLSEPVLLREGQQTRVDYLKPPLKPFALKEKMLKHKKKMSKLRERLSEVKKKWRRANKIRSKKLRRKLKKKIHKRLKEKTE